MYKKDLVVMPEKNRPFCECTVTVWDAEDE